MQSINKLLKWDPSQTIHGLSGVTQVYNVANNFIHKPLFNPIPDQLHIVIVCYYNVPKQHKTLLCKIGRKEKKFKACPFKSCNDNTNQNLKSLRLLLKIWKL